jgi:hypothetical protein
MHHRHVHRREDRDLLGDRAKCGRKREGLETMGANVELAAKSLPARDRRMNSKPALSTIFATSTMSGQLACQRSGTLVIAMPPSALSENRPSFSRLEL